VVMIATGIFLAMQYTPHVDYAFNSVERIMRDVNYGWMLRYIHMNGASMFFIAVYIHIFRGDPSDTSAPDTTPSAPYAPTAFLDPADTGELRLEARHGSLTPAEMLVPLISWPSP